MRTVSDTTSRFCRPKSTSPKPSRASVRKTPARRRRRRTIWNGAQPGLAGADRGELGGGLQGSDLAGDLTSLVPARLRPASAHRRRPLRPGGRPRRRPPSPGCPRAGRRCRRCLQYQQVTLIVWCRSEAEVPRGPAAGNGEPELAAGRLERGTEPIFDQGWLTEIRAEIDGAARRRWPAGPGGGDCRDRRAGTETCVRDRQLHRALIR